MSDLDLDELLELLEKEAELRPSKKRYSSKKDNSHKDSCARFIRKMNVSKGLERVPNYVIYYTYKKIYKGAINEKKWSKHHFFRLFNKEFQQVRTGKQRYYLLDDGPFDLTREGLLEAKKYDEEYQIEVKKARGTFRPKRKRRISKDDKRRKKVPVSTKGT